jgi:hypothetical protein
VQWWNWRSLRGWAGSMRVIGSVLRKRVHGSRRVGLSTPPPVSQTKAMCPYSLVVELPPPAMHR